DLWSGQATGAIAGYYTYWTPNSGMAPNRSQVKIGAAVPQDAPLSLSAGTEYYCFNLRLSATKTVGTGACAGCSTPVCIVLSQINSVQSDGNNELLTDPVTANILTWQSASNCASGMAPRQNVLWGQIRSALR